MSSILSDIETTIDNGTSIVIAENIFAKILENIVRKHGTDTPVIAYNSKRAPLINRYIDKEIDLLKYSSVKDLYDVFLLSKDEIHQFCKSDYVKKVQDAQYFSCFNYDFSINVTNEMHVKYTVNLTNALYLLTGGDVFVNCNNEMKRVSELDETYNKNIKRAITGAKIYFSSKFYECLKKFCFDNYESFAHHYIVDYTINSYIVDPLNNKNINSKLNFY